MEKKKLKEKVVNTNREIEERKRAYIVYAMCAFLGIIIIWGTVFSVNTSKNYRTITTHSKNEKVENNNKNAGKTISVKDLTNEILDKVTFETELNLIDDSVAASSISTTEGSTLNLYMGNGTYADSLIIVESKSDSDGKENQKYVEEYLDCMEKDFNTYNPTEAKKIKDAVKIRCGGYVFVCVTKDTSTAEKIIQSYIK